MELDARPALLAGSFLNFKTSIKFYNSAFSQPFSIDFLSKSHNLKHFLMLDIAIVTDLPILDTILTKLLIFSLVCLGAVTSGRRLILHRYYSPASHALRMLGPAVNRQPGFRRGTRRAKQRREDQPRWLAGWLAGCLAGCWLGPSAGSAWAAG